MYHRQLPTSRACKGEHGWVERAQEQVINLGAALVGGSLRSVCRQRLDAVMHVGRSLCSELLQHVAFLCPLWWDSLSSACGATLSTTTLRARFQEV